MTAIGLYQILFFFALILALTKPLGVFMARVFEGERTFLHPVLRPARAADLPAQRHSRGRRAALDPVRRARCWRSPIAKFVFTYLIQRLQGFLPLNPQGFSTSHAAMGATR